jgi:hypothetical protein
MRQVQLIGITPKEFQQAILDGVERLSFYIGNSVIIMD